MEHAPDWMRALEPRELAQVYHALAYAKDFSAAGVPGHSQHMLIAKLAGLLDKWSMPESKPMQEGLLTPADPPKFDPPRPPGFLRKPGGFA